MQHFLGAELRLLSEEAVECASFDLSVVAPATTTVRLEDPATCVPVTWLVEWAGSLSVGAINAAHGAFGNPTVTNAIDSCMNTACTGERIARAIAHVGGWSAAVCCDSRPTAAFQLSELHVSGDQHPTAISAVHLAASALGPGWSDVVSHDTRSISSVVPGVPDLVSLTGRADLLYVSGGRAFAFGLPGTMPL